MTNQLQQLKDSDVDINNIHLNNKEGDQTAVTTSFSKMTRYY